MKKISVVLFLFLLFSSFPVFVGADEAGLISVDNVSCKSGEFVDVNIRIANNPGIIATLFSIEYDNQSLELIEVSDKGLLGENAAFFGNNINAIPYTMSWENALSRVDFSANGVLVTLKFKAREEASPGEYAIKINLDKNSTFNTNLDNVEFEAQNGSIIIMANDNNNTSNTPETDINSFNSNPTENNNTQTNDMNDETTADIENTKGKIEVGQAVYTDNGIIEIPVTLTKNPGIMALALTIEYDKNMLELLDVTDEQLFPSDITIRKNESEDAKYQIIWENISGLKNLYNEGTLAKITFKFKENIEQNECEISINYDGTATYNDELENIDFEILNGLVKINKEDLQNGDKLSPKSIVIIIVMAVVSLLILLYVILKLQKKGKGMNSVNK